MRTLALVALVFVTACHREPDFDERYEKAESEIRAKAESIDKDLEQRAKQDGASSATAGDQGAKPEPSR